MALSDDIMQHIQGEREELIGLLRKPLSKQHFSLLASRLLARPELIGLVSDVIESGEPGDARRAAWLLSNAFDLDAGLLVPHQEKLIRLVLLAKEDSVRRSLLRVIDGAAVPRQYQGALFDACMQWMISERYAIAVRCNAMQILYRICLEEPELSAELIQQIQELISFGSAGFKSRGNKIISRLKKQQNSSK